MITAHSDVGGLGLGSSESLMMPSTPSSPLVTESLELMKLETGKYKPVLEEKNSQHGYLVTLYWLTSVLEFDQHFKLSLYIPIITTP